MKKIIGQLIHDRIKDRKMTIAEFCREINLERSTVYDIFKRSSIDTDVLEKIGHILDYDFFVHFLKSDTIDRLKMSHKVSNAKVIVEIELTEHEIDLLKLEERAKEKVYYIKGTNLVAEPIISYKQKGDF